MPPWNRASLALLTLVGARPCSSGSAPRASASATASASAPGCTVVVGALLSSASYRGPGPITPAIADQMRADPEFQRAYDAISHGDEHLQCVYRVEVNGKAYRFRHIEPNTRHPYGVERCDDLRPKVTSEIVEVTSGCTDLASGAYYGYVFEPL